jgi:hypothetical protein
MESIDTIEILLEFAKEATQFDHQETHGLKPRHAIARGELLQYAWRS